jgi:hypothetical protein
VITAYLNARNVAVMNRSAASRGAITPVTRIIGPVTKPEPFDVQRFSD